MNTRGYRVLDSFLAWIKRFFKESPAALFIIGFQALLVACAFLLIVQMAGLAESLGVGAYVMLVIGVIVQLVLFLRESHNG